MKMGCLLAYLVTVYCLTKWQIADIISTGSICLLVLAKRIVMLNVDHVIDTMKGICKDIEGGLLLNMEILWL